MPGSRRWKIRKWGEEASADAPCRIWGPDTETVEVVEVNPAEQSALERLAEELKGRARVEEKAKRWSHAATFNAFAYRLRQEIASISPEPEPDTRPLALIEQRPDEPTRRVIVHVEPDRVEEILDAVTPIVAQSPLSLVEEPQEGDGR